MTVSLYAFLFLAIFRMWKGFQGSTEVIGKQKFPTIQLNAISSQYQATLNQSEILLGRNEENDITIDDETVSAIHSRIFFRDKQWLLEDFNSTNGTFLNDLRILMPTALISGDVISFGRVSFEILIPENLNP